jgi:hypothetical protein
MANPLDCPIQVVHVYLSKSRGDAVTVITEVDPLNFTEIYAAIGGNWVFVGLVFALFFSVPSGGAYINPTTPMARLLGLKVGDNDENV